MKILVNICRYLVYFIGVLLIILALDCFGDDNFNFWEEIFCFLVSSIPGLSIILLNYFLRKKELIMGILLIVISIFFMFFFKFHQDIKENIITILIINLPLFIFGMVFIISHNEHIKK